MQQVSSCHATPLPLLCIRPFSTPARHASPQSPSSLSGGITSSLSPFSQVTCYGVLSYSSCCGLSTSCIWMVTVAGNNQIDITPSVPSRGEAVGYCGLMNNTAKELRPDDWSFHAWHIFLETIFACSLISGTIGFVAACLNTFPPKQPVKREPISLDRFVLLKGIPAGIALLLLSIHMAWQAPHVAMYAKEIGITLNSGLFYFWRAVGMAVSRMFGKQVIKDVSPSHNFRLYLVCSCFHIVRLRTTDEDCPKLTNILFLWLPPIGSRLGR